MKKIFSFGLLDYSMVLGKNICVDEFTRKINTIKSIHAHVGRCSLAGRKGNCKMSSKNDVVDLLTFGFASVLNSNITFISMQYCA